MNFEETKVPTKLAGKREPSITKLKKTNMLLIDADSLIYQAAAVNEECELETAQSAFVSLIEQIRAVCPSTLTYIFIKGMEDKNFRYLIDGSYKQSRKTLKPLKHLYALKAWVIASIPNVVTSTFWESDDAVSSYYHRYGRNSCRIAACDKDVLCSLEGTHYNYLKGEVVETSKLEALRFPYLQCLMGDPADSVKGIRGIGPKSANIILPKIEDEAELWDIVLKTYEAYKLTKEDALRTMRLVNIHQVFENRKLCLFDEFYIFNKNYK